MSFRPVTTATINGRRWRIGYGFPGKTKGKVDDGSSDEGLKKIVVLTARCKRSRCLEEVIAHEILHAMAPNLSEDFCTEFGETFDRVLRKMRPADEV